MAQYGYLDSYVLVLRDIFLNDSLVLLCYGRVRHFGWTLGRIVDVLRMMMRVENSVVFSPHMLLCVSSGRASRVVLVDTASWINPSDVASHQL